MATRYMRWGWAVAGMAMLSICGTTTATATQTSVSPTEPHYGMTIVLADHASIIDQLAVFDAVVIEKRVAREHPVPRPMALKVRASRQAVLPSSIAGWRSGRIKSLSS